MRFAIMAIILGVICCYVYIEASVREKILLPLVAIIIYACGVTTLMCFAGNARHYYPEEIAAYQEQKECIESHRSTNPAIEEKKAELNHWLHEAQAHKERWGWWSAWPDEILELKPIE